MIDVFILHEWAIIQDGMSIDQLRGYVFWASWWSLFFYFIYFFIVQYGAFRITFQIASGLQTPTKGVAYATFWGSLLLKFLPSGYTQMHDHCCLTNTETALDIVVQSSLLFLHWSNLFLFSCTRPILCTVLHVVICSRYIYAHHTLCRLHQNPAHGTALRM